MYLDGQVNSAFKQFIDQVVTICRLHYNAGPILIKPQ